MLFAPAYRQKSCASRPSSVRPALSLTRARGIMMPRARVRLSAGRTELGREAQLFCLYAGANSIFYGERLLTTPNPGPDDDSELIRAAGLQVTGAALD